MHAGVLYPYIRACMFGKYAFKPVKKLLLLLLLFLGTDITLEWGSSIIPSRRALFGHYAFPKSVFLVCFIPRYMQLRFPKELHELVD